MDKAEVLEMAGAMRSYVNDRAILAFAARIEALALERAAKLCDEKAFEERDFTASVRYGACAMDIRALKKQ